MAHVGSAIDPAQAIRRRERELTKYADSYPTTVPRQVQVGRNLIAGVAIQNALRQGIITRAAADTLELVSAGQCADK